MVCMTESCVRIYSALVSHIGLFLSAYALYVEKMKEVRPEYTAMCDINEHMSCSRVFTSQYGTGFGVIGQLLGNDHALNVPNSFYGALFYSGMSLLSLGDGVWLKLQLLASVVSLFGSAYLAYILYFVLHDLCVVCVSTYVINLVLFMLTLCRYIYSPPNPRQPKHAAKKRSKRD